MNHSYLYEENIENLQKTSFLMKGNFLKLIKQNLEQKDYDLFLKCVNKLKMKEILNIINLFFLNKCVQLSNISQ